MTFNFCGAISPESLRLHVYWSRIISRHADIAHSQSAHPSTTTVIVPNEYHVPMAIDSYIGIKRESEMSKAIKSWLSSRL